MIREEAMPFDFGNERDDEARAEDRLSREEAAPTLEPMTGRDPLDTELRGSDRSTEAAPSTAEPIQRATLVDDADGDVTSADDGASSAALRDAAAIAARIATDEGAADAERERLSREAMPVLDAEDDLVFQMARDEVLHAVRGAALVERGQDAQPSGGILYLTSRRLVHIGTEAVEEVRLADIADMAVAMERLLLIELVDGSDLAIEVDQPRLLRVQVSAARATLREHAS